MQRLLDSVILIDHFNDIPAASEYLRGLSPETTAVSVITRAELLVGLEGSGLAKAKVLLDQYVLLSIDGPIADKAAELRRLYGWKLPDAFQAALAIMNSAKLVTRNTKDFDPARHQFIEIPYTL
ncbi:MAG: type II toxin-antitoxin system VapC family toxin [Desulfobacteraceae bacterium]|nr:MAG: type II toxin-antitoxin system VapC family toxin [Desulfobacteraceae bacterium]